MPSSESKISILRIQHKAAPLAELLRRPLHYAFASAVGAMNPLIVA
jgi:hypothetical protein